MIKDEVWNVSEKIKLASVFWIHKLTWYVSNCVKLGYGPALSPSERWWYVQGDQRDQADHHYHGHPGGEEQHRSLQSQDIPAVTQWEQECGAELTPSSPEHRVEESWLSSSGHSCYSEEASRRSLLLDGPALWIIPVSPRHLQQIRLLRNALSRRADHGVPVIRDRGRRTR